MQTAANYPGVDPNICYKAEVYGEHVENTYAWLHPSLGLCGEGKKQNKQTENHQKDKRKQIKKAG